MFLIYTNDNEKRCQVIRKDLICSLDIFTLHNGGCGMYISFADGGCVKINFNPYYSFETIQSRLLPFLMSEIRRFHHDTTIDSEILRDIATGAK